MALHPAFAPLDAPTLVEASAGTGKTYTITTYFVRGIIERGLSPEQILVVTYTKAATADLRKRARKRIVEAIERLDGPLEKPDLLDELLAPVVEKEGRDVVERRLRSALANMDQAAISTIHGFCQRLLQDHPLAFGIDFDFEVSEDLSSMYAELATDFWASELYAKPEWFVHALRERKVDPRLLAKLADVATSPRVRLLGPEPVDLDSDLVDRARRAHQTAGELWFAHRTEVQRILLEDESLHRGRYGKASVPGWFPELDQVFRRDGLPSLPKFFEKLAQERIVVKKNCDRPQHVFFEACEELLDSREGLGPMFDRAVFELQTRFLGVAEAEVHRRRAETGILSFDDLLTIVHAQIVDDPSVAEVVASSYPLALVDEFQDTDSLQYGIFRAAYGAGACVYVGDPKQAIYAFRGADVYSYITAVDDVGEREWTLDTNRRSDPSMVDAVNRLFGRPDDAFLVGGIDFDPVHAHESKDRTTLSPALDFVWLDETHLESEGASIAEVAACEVASLLQSDETIEGRRVEPGDIAVLCRSNAKACDVTEALRALNVPTSLEGDSSVLSTQVAGSIRVILEAAVLPGDARGVRRALLTPLLGVSPQELVDMSDEEWTAWVTRFQRWHELWRENGVVRFIDDMLREGDAEARIAATPTAKRDLTDLLHIEELLMRGERERQRDPVALLQWYRRLEDGSPDDGMVRSEDLQQRPDAGSGAVRVTTIHKSKGLEYGIVFCPFTWKDASLFDDEKKALKFHDEDRAILVDLGSPNREAHLAQAELEKLSEALRVLYVALTRAKHRSTVFWGRRPGWHGSALGVLLHGAGRDPKTEEAELLAELQAFAESSGGTIGCREPVAMPVAPLTDEPVTTDLEARASKRSYDHSPRIASFSSLTGHDDKVPPRREADEDEPLGPPLFSVLPGGTRTGLFLHSILEDAELASIDSEKNRSTIEKGLRDYGFATSLAAEIHADLAVVCETPLVASSAGPTLGALENSLRELEFTLSLNRPSLERLAGILEDHGAPRSAPAYPSRLREIEGQSLESFLRGYIDLVFEWNGRWYVADYKSNSLPGYGQAAVTEAVQREHYVLQGLLYSAAARRYLRARLPEFDPHTHWGGTMFLFLRGMGGANAPGSSIFFDPLTPELLEDLDAWLGDRDEPR